jgi:hypothetical protein
MSAISIGAAMVLGTLHGYVVWIMVFRAVSPIVSLIIPPWAADLRVAREVGHVFVFFFLLAMAFVVLLGLGQLVDPDVSTELRAYLFSGSALGFLLSGAVPRVEARMRGIDLGSDDPPPGQA